MPTFGLTIKAEVENLTAITLSNPENYQFSVKFKCSNCQEDHDRHVVFAASDIVAHSNGKAESNIFKKCNFCSTEGSCNILLDSLNPYCPNGGGEKYIQKSKPSKSKRSNSPKRKNGSNTKDSEHVLIELEARNLIPISWEPFDGWKAYGIESGSLFDGINLEDEWSDFDEKADLPVMITDIVAGVTGRV